MPAGDPSWATELHAGDRVRYLGSNPPAPVGIVLVVENDREGERAFILWDEGGSSWETPLNVAREDEP